MASPGMPSCLATAAPVTTSSPVTMRTRMLASWADRTASRDSGAGRIDHPDQRGQLQALDQGQQVAVGVEVRGVDVLHGRGHDAQALAAEAIHLLRRPACSARSPQGTDSPLARADVARPITAGAAPLTKTRTTGLPDVVLGVAEGGHQLVGGVERQGREPRVGRLGALDVELGLVPEDQQRALGGVADDLAVDELGVVGDQERQDRRLDGVGVARRCARPRRRGRSPSR